MSAIEGKGDSSEGGGSKPKLPPTIRIGRSKITEKQISMLLKCKCIKNPNFVRTSKGEVTPNPRDYEMVVFMDYFLAGLRLPCDEFLGEVLERYNLEPHDLTSNGIARPKKAKFIDSDEDFETQYGSCSFTPKKRGPSLVVAQKNKWSDWTNYWFYYRVVANDEVRIAKEKGKRKAHPLVSKMTNFFEVTSPESTLTEIAQKAIRVFMYAAAGLTTRDMTEEYMAARVVPLMPRWRPKSIQYFGTPGQSLGYPVFGMNKEAEFEGKSDEEIVALVEVEVVDVVGPYVVEYERVRKVFGANKRLNRVFAEIGVQYSPRPVLVVNGSTVRAKKRR